VTRRHSIDDSLAPCSSTTRPEAPLAPVPERYRREECRVPIRSGRHNLPIEELRICRIVERKWAEYRPVLPRATLRFLDREPYLDVARADPRVRDELVLGWFDDFEAQFREPVLADVSTEVVTVCPPIMRERVEPEPPQIQRAYVEGAFLRRLFRLLVDGEGWELDAQVRDVMARHFSFLLAAVEVVDADRT
jgi:hypothetical protein